MKDSLRQILGLPIKTPIEYWDKYWGHITKILSEKDNFEISLDSPRFLIDNIISEIEYNNLKNRDNSILFRTQLCEWDKKDVVFNELFHNKVVLLQKKWDESAYKYILFICKQIKIKMNDGIYFNALIDRLINVISTAKSLEYNIKKDISKYVELIIAEFIANGFVIEDIKSIHHDIPQIFRDVSGSVISAPDNFNGLKISNYDDEESYYKAIEDYINNRTIEERISILRDCYNIEPTDCFVIFRLSGIRGDMDCMIDDINIYPPHLKKYITEISTLSKIEQTTSERKYINAAIPVKHKMLHSSIDYARQRLESFIDLLSLSFNTSKPIKYCNENISIIENGRCIGSINLNIIDEEKIFKHQDFLKYVESLDISNLGKDLNKLDERFTAINREQSCDTLKLATAAHWYQKGKDAQNSEDKLLFHWIAIESLLKTDISIRCNIIGHKEASLLQTVQKISSSIIVKNFFRNYCLNTYIDIIYKTQQFDNYLDIPDEIIKSASLNLQGGDRININKFFSHIEDFETTINDEILKTELHELNSFYNNNNGIKDKEQDVNNDIIFIYRLRNLIAHNAVFPRYLIDLYANKAQYISGNIIRHLIEEYRNTNLALEDILINISSTYDEFVLNIEEEISKLKS